jgi:hypothetical protein
MAALKAAQEAGLIIKYVLYYGNLANPMNGGPVKRQQNTASWGAVFSVLSIGVTGSGHVI